MTKILRSEDIKTFFPIVIVEIVIIKKIVHIKEFIHAHIADVSGCHSFRWIIHVLFAQFLYIGFHSGNLLVRSVAYFL